MSTRYSTASVFLFCIRIPTHTLISYIGMLPSGCAMLYYLFDVQVFRQPLCLLQRGQHGSIANCGVASLVAMETGMWLIQQLADMTVIILCDNSRLLLPVGSFTVLTYPTHPTAHPRSGLAARIDEQLSDKITTILKLYISLCVVLWWKKWNCCAGWPFVYLFIFK